MCDQRSVTLWVNTRILLFNTHYSRINKKHEVSNITVISNNAKNTLYKCVVGFYLLWFKHRSKNTLCYPFAFQRILWYKQWSLYSYADISYTYWFLRKIIKYILACLEYKLFKMKNTNLSFIVRLTHTILSCFLTC